MSRLYRYTQLGRLFPWEERPPLEWIRQRDIFEFARHPSPRKIFCSLVLWICSVELFAFAAVLVNVARVRQAFLDLKKPEWIVPGWFLIGIYAVVNALLAISAWLIYLDGPWMKHLARMVPFCGVLVIEGLWPDLFFDWKAYLAVFVLTIVAIALAAICLVLFWRVIPLSGALLVPYIGWLSYLSALGREVGRLNS